MRSREALHQCMQRRRQEFFQGRALGGSRGGLTSHFSISRGAQPWFLGASMVKMKEFSGQGGPWPPLAYACLCPWRSPIRVLDERSVLDAFWCFSHAESERDIKYSNFCHLHDTRMTLQSKHWTNTPGPHVRPVFIHTTSNPYRKSGKYSHIQYGI